MMGTFWKHLKSKLLLFFTSFLTFSKDKIERHCYNAIAEIHIVQSGGCNFYIEDTFDMGLNYGQNYQEFSYIWL